MMAPLHCSLGNGGRPDLLKNTSPGLSPGFWLQFTSLCVWGPLQADGGSPGQGLWDLGTGLDLVFAAPFSSPQLCLPRNLLFPRGENGCWVPAPLVPGEMSSFSQRAPSISRGNSPTRNSVLDRGDPLLCESSENSPGVVCGMRYSCCSQV